MTAMASQSHQPHDCLLDRLFRRKSKKTSKLRLTGLCEGNSPVAGELPAQRASNAENVSIWWWLIMEIMWRLRIDDAQSSSDFTQRTLQIHNHRHIIGEFIPSWEFPCAARKVQWETSLGTKILTGNPLIMRGFILFDISQKHLFCLYYVPEKAGYSICTVRLPHSEA